MNPKINVFAQNSILINGSYTIYFDPFHIPENFHDADYVFITHPHWDHFSLIDLLKVRKEETSFFVPKEIFEELLDIGVKEEQIKVVKPGETYYFEKMSFQTIPAYNRLKEHHLKQNNWMGFLLNMDEIIYYIAGDTDIIEENQNIKADVLFLPVSGTYTMDYQEASKLANLIHPKLAIPTHYLTVVGDIKDAINFCNLLEKDIKSKIFYKEK